MSNYRKKVPTTTVTRDMDVLSKPVGNVYETVRIIAKRANQISTETKHELEQKLQVFASVSDSMEEVFENREQIEVSRYYERMPKPTLRAIEEFSEGKVYYKNPAKINTENVH